MKKLILLALVLFSAVTMLAQTNRMSYQAVVRNAANELVAEENLTVAIRISDANSTSAFSETHSVTSNRNGVISLMIGEGSGQSGNMTSVDWRTAQIHTVVTLSDGATLTNTTPVNAVPYAFYADSVDIHWVNDAVDDYLEHHSIGSIVETDPTVPAWAKEATKPVYDYSEIENTPTIPTNVGELTNDANYITLEQVPAQVNADWNATEGAAQILNKPELFSGDYNDLTNKPTIPTVPTNVGAFTNDAGYITAEEVPAVSVPTNVSEFNNDAEYVTTNQLNAANYITAADVPEQVNADWNATTGAAQILNKPELFSGDYNDLTNTPTIPTVPTNVGAFTNDAGYITAAEVPAVSVPTNVSAFNNDAEYVTTNQLNAANYITAADVPAQVNADWNATTGAAQILNKPELFSGDYNDLTNKPTIPTVPANVGAFTNDAGYITAAEVPAVSVPTNVSAFDNDAEYVTTNQLNAANYITAADVPAQVNADWNATEGAAQILNKPELFSGDYNDLTNTPTIPTVPTNVGAFTNDAGYITAAEVPAVSVPTNVSAFNNDAEYVTTNQLNAANYITAADVPAQVNADWDATTGAAQILNKPTDVSAFTNDAGYITGYTETQTLADVTAQGNSAGNRQLKNVSDPTDPQDAVTKTYLDQLVNNLTGLVQNLQQQLDSLQNVVDALTGGSTTVTQPTVTTSAATNVTSTSAMLNGNVSNPDNVAITTQGFEWKATSGGAYVAVNATGETMTYNLTGLTAGTSYTYRAFVTTAEGTSYGETVSFTTLAAGGGAVIDEKSCHGTPTVTDHEGNVYATVQIGDQCWMRENLRTTTSPKTGTYLVNTSNKSGNSASTFDGSKVAHWCMNDSATYAPKGYGLLYNWCAVMDTANPSGYVEVPTESSGNNNSFTFNPSGKHRGICPEGWHVPTDAEWSTMEAVVNGSNVSSLTGYRGSHAGKLAGGNDWDSTSTTNAPGNYSSTVRNSTGFTVVPAGYFYTSFNQTRIAAILWTSSQRSEAYKAWGRYFRYENVGVGRYTNSYHGQGRSVRCLRDETGGGTALTEPTVTTSAATDVTETSATLNGSISNPDNVAITAQGFEWKATAGGAYVAVNATGETMTYNLTGLTAGTSYTYRAFVTTAESTSYGEEVSFTTEENSIPADDAQPCPGIPTVTDYEGNTYNTVLIGQQCWMRENLRTTKYADGTSISQGTSDSTTTAYWAYPNGNSSNKTLYGLLYNWKAVMRNSSSSSANPSGVQGICPTGWHVPSDAEWVQLKNHIMSQSQFWCGSENYKISKAMSSTTGWNTSTGTCVPGNDLSSNNATGFSALPAGNFSSSSNYNYFRSFVYIWSATEENSTKTYNWRLNKDEVEMYRRSTDKYFGFSVRCLHDSLVAID